MKYTNVILENDELQDALATVDMKDSVTGVVNGRIPNPGEVDCKPKIMEMLGCEWMSACHPFLNSLLYKLTPEFDGAAIGLTESEAEKVNKLYDLGKSRGFINEAGDEPDEDSSSKEKDDSSSPSSDDGEGSGEDSEDSSPDEDGEEDSRNDEDGGGDNGSSQTKAEPEPEDEEPADSSEYADNPDTGTKELEVNFSDVAETDNPDQPKDDMLDAERDYAERLSRCLNYDDDEDDEFYGESKKRSHKKGLNEAFSQDYSNVTPHTFHKEIPSDKKTVYYVVISEDDDVRPLASWFLNLKFEKIDADNDSKVGSVYLDKIIDLAKKAEKKYPDMFIKIFKEPMHSGKMPKIHLNYGKSQFKNASSPIAEYIPGDSSGYGGMWVLKDKLYHYELRDLVGESVSEASKDILSKNDGLVANVFLNHEEEINSKGTDTGVSTDEFKKFLTELMEKEADDIPSRRKILINISRMRDKISIISYLYNLMLKAKGLGTGGHYKESVSEAGEKDSSDDEEKEKPSKKADDSSEEEDSEDDSEDDDEESKSSENSMDLKLKYSQLFKQTLASLKLKSVNKATPQQRAKFWATIYKEWKIDGIDGPVPFTFLTDKEQEKLDRGIFIGQ